MIKKFYPTIIFKKKIVQLEWLLWKDVAWLKHEFYRLDLYTDRGWVWSVVKYGETRFGVRLRARTLHFLFAYEKEEKELQ